MASGSAQDSFASVAAHLEDIFSVIPGWPHRHAGAHWRAVRRPQQRAVPSTDIAYAVGKKIGEGSFGVVFEGHTLEDNKPVAIKFVSGSHILHLLSWAFGSP